MALSDTIAAIATAPGRAGVAVVRVSGAESFAIAERLCARRPEHGRFFLARLSFDEVIVLGFAAPHSYTGEDVVEFQCHGGAVSPRRTLEACLALGARLARRGEFTERALLNGRIDYDQAESVLDLVNARTDCAADAALEGIAGRRRRELRDVYEQTLAISCELEHALDVDESDLPDDFLPRLEDRVKRIAASLRAVLERDRRNGILRNGALVVLAGKPNVGKSSLLNALLGEQRAIVSETAGTTRDSIEAWLDIGGFPVRLVDTAGLRHGSDVSDVEAEGVKRSEMLMASADLVLALSEEYDAAPADSPRTIYVRTKLDLHRGDTTVEGVFDVSSASGEGLHDLEREIAARIATLEIKDDSVGMDKLVSALTALDDFNVEDPVLAANAVRSASNLIGESIGAQYSSDLLDRLFSRFCVGK